MRAPLIVLAACAGLAVPAAGQPPKLNPDAATLVKDNTAFALDLYRELAQKDGNLFFSPYSISTALAMTYHYSARAVGVLAVGSVAAWRSGRPYSFAGGTG